MTAAADQITQRLDEALALLDESLLRMHVELVAQGLDDQQVRTTLGPQRNQLLDAAIKLSDRPRRLGSWTERSSENRFQDRSDDTLVASIYREMHGWIIYQQPAETGPRRVLTADEFHDRFVAVIPTVETGDWWAYPTDNPDSEDPQLYWIGCMSGLSREPFSEMNCNLKRYDVLGNYRGDKFLRVRELAARGTKLGKRVHIGGRRSAHAPMFPEGDVLASELYEALASYGTIHTPDGVRAELAAEQAASETAGVA